MEILEILGLNQTLVTQFIIFFTAYMALSRLVFVPYLKAYQKRQEATGGNKKNAETLLQEVEVLQEKYSKEARALNTEIKKHFDHAKISAHAVVSEKVNQARTRAEKEIKENREDLVRIKAQLKNDIDIDLPQIRSVIVHQLLGKEMS